MRRRHHTGVIWITRLVTLIAACVIAGAEAQNAVSDPVRAADLTMGMPSGPGRVAQVQLQFSAFTPARVSVLTGDTVTWTDVSRTHTVTAADGSWSSGDISLGDTFMREFGAPGVVHYYCQIHPFMHGVIDIADLLLDSAGAPASPSRPYPLRGRAALPQGTQVSIEGDIGSGFQPVTMATVAADGTFVAEVNPKSTTTYRAVHDATASPPVLLRVMDRRVLLTDNRRGGRDHLTVQVRPASPGSTVVLQLYLRERFGWWPVQQLRLNRASRARFVVGLDRRVPARVALTLPDGATQLRLSPSLRVGRR